MADLASYIALITAVLGLVEKVYPELKSSVLKLGGVLARLFRLRKIQNTGHTYYLQGSFGKSTRVCSSLVYDTDPLCYLNLSRVPGLKKHV
jgi:hypothetical protein